MLLFAAYSMTEPNSKDLMQWDARTWSRALPFWESHFTTIAGGQAIELGGREGGLSLYLACKGLRVLCSDIEDVSEKARPLHKQFGVEHQISYGVVDATNIPFENHFDVVIFKSIIGGIGRNDHPELQQQTFDSIYRSLKPGGVLLFAENLAGSPLHSFMRKKFVRWGNEWRYVQLNELHHYLRNFKKHEIKTTGFAAAFGRTESQRNFLSYFDSAILNYTVPSDWHYVAFGVAVK
jgi:SAM-dependent methyltransferase